MSEFSTAYYGNVTGPPGKKFEIGWTIPVYITCILGFLFNSFTISAILYARYKKRHGFYKDWYVSHIFVLNLTIWDLVASFFMMVMYTHFTLGAIFDKNHLGLNRHECAFLAIIRDIVIYVEIYAVVLIAITRMLYLKKRTFWKNFCSSRWKVIGLIGIEWILGGFIWNANRIKDAVIETSEGNYGMCMTVYSNVNKGSHLTGESSTVPFAIDYISHFLAFAAVIGSYVFIRSQYNQTQQAIEDKNAPYQDIKSKKKDNQLTKTMFIICSVFILSSSLRLIARGLCFFHDKHREGVNKWCGDSWFIQFNAPWIRLFYIAYYTQFVTNLIIYIFQRDLYWKACKDLISKITKAKRKNVSSSSGTNPNSRINPNSNDKTKSKMANTSSVATG